MQQTALGHRQRSDWLQPWRAYLDTRPASDLANGTGIVFDPPPDQVAQTAELLDRSGFTRARYVVDWSLVTRTSAGLAFLSPWKFDPVIKAFRDHGLRPMILLNALPRRSGLARSVTLTLAANAAAGSVAVKLDPASIAKVRVGRTGFAGTGQSHDGLLIYEMDPAALITSVAADGTARLSRPLDRALAAGPVSATTLEFAPFERPMLSDGSGPNPDFERTLAGWLEYVGFVTRSVRDVLGTDAFDVEIWNELSFDSEFLDANAYHEPDVDIGTGDTNRRILEATVAYLADPANGVPRVRAGDGFANNDPYPSGASAPPGLAAINRHPYAPLWDVYPGVARMAAAIGSPLGDQVLDALGTPVGRRAFVPTYRSYFPEHYLTGMQWDHLIRDLSPITTEVEGRPHGRHTRPDGGAPPRIWVSEHNLKPDVPTPAINRHLQAKIVLRSLIAHVAKGAELVALYSVDDKDFGLVSPDFFNAARADPGRYPGDELGGRTMAAIRRLSRTVGSGTPAGVRPLSLESISDCHNHAQFAGSNPPDPRFPPLYHRDVLTFFPFQATERRYVIPFWVMTRDVAKVYRPELPADDLRRYDFPPERFSLEIGGLGGGDVRVDAVDPVSGARTPATVTGRQGANVTVEVEATDSPRLLIVER
jgi:hypothetical protein